MKSYEEIKKLGIDDVQQYLDEVSYGKVKVIVEVVASRVGNP